MADYNSIMGALRKADAAGDTEGAKRLAVMAREAQVTPTEPPDDQSFNSSILPFSKDEQGNVSFDSNMGILGGLKRALTLPRDVMKGEVDPMSDEGIGRVLEMATIASPINPAMRAGSKAIPGISNTLKRQDIEPPTVEMLKSEAKAGFDEVRGMGVDYSSSHVVDMARATQQKLEAEGFNSENAKQTFSLLNKLQSAPADSVAPLSGLATARKSFNKVPKKIDDEADFAAAQMARERLDKFIMEPNAETVVAGPATSAGEALKRANANYAARKRSDRLTGVQTEADIRAAAANSGKNVGNSTRQKIASLLLNEKKKRGFSQAELEALEGVVEGSTAANATRNVGNMLGGGGGVGALLAAGAGGMAGGAVGAPGIGAMALPAVGMGSKALSNQLTKKALSAADALVRKRSPLYERMLSEAPVIANAPNSRNALIRALLLQQQAGN